ncbi:MAG: eight-cysteine-cluster domain-containing protein [Nitrospinae bacterium]|nr:eight-cysteine-cluster domain-containing protein [Nitrospinota bacterium]
MKQSNKPSIRRWLMAGLAITLMGAFFAFGPQACSTSSTAQEPGDTTPTEEFCGWSTEGYCESDMDCVVSGCSSEVCQSTRESEYNTICQWRDCYDPEPYQLHCGCVNSACQWGNGST